MNLHQWNKRRIPMSTEAKKLYRSTDNRWLAGVCGGLAKHFDIDPTLVRIVFIALALVGLGGVILYLLLWVLVPTEPTAGEQAMMDHIIDQEIAEEENGIIALPFLNLFLRAVTIAVTLGMTAIAIGVVDHQ